MSNKNLEDIQKSSNLWAESGFSNDISDDDMFNISNLSNMMSMSSISSMSNTYMPSMPTIVNINSGDTLQKNREEKSFLNKK
jgi:hypothetical protein